MIENSISNAQIQVRISHSILVKLVQLEKIVPRKIATVISIVRIYYENKDIIKQPNSILGLIINTKAQIQLVDDHQNLNIKIQPKTKPIPNKKETSMSEINMIANSISIPQVML